MESYLEAVLGNSIGIFLSMQMLGFALGLSYGINDGPIRNFSYEGYRNGMIKIVGEQIGIMGADAVTISTYLGAKAGNELGRIRFPERD